MPFHRSLIALVALLLAPLTLPAQAAPAEAPEAALGRFIVISSTYRDMAVEFDDRIVLRQPANTLSGYITMPAFGHLVIYGIRQSGDSGRTVINGYTAPGRAQPSGKQIIVVQENGPTNWIRDNAAPVPAGKSMLRLIVAEAGAPLPELRFGTQPLAFDSREGTAATHLVDPQTARLELRAPGSGRLLRWQYLRAQPGYRYEIMVGRVGGSGGDYHLVVAPVSPQLVAGPTETRLFSETGHYLEGRLRQYWESTGGLPVFGFPLNDDHLERTPEGAFVTQVFERNRLEYHPEKQAPYDVLLGRLGDERLRQLGRDWRSEWSARPIEPGCEAMQTGERQLAVCEPFRAYYHAHGLEFDGRQGFSPAESLALFGLPLTQARVETNSSGDRVLTQWFERARLEYHPNNPAAYRVLLGRLGAEVYELQPFTFDDEDRGFSRFSNPSGADWNEASGGFGGHYWWTCTESAVVGGGDDPSHGARWEGPPLRGTYDVQVFIPAVHSNSQNVRYGVRHGDHDWVIIPFSQRPYGNQWVSLGTAEPSWGVGVTISSNTGEREGCTNQVAADAIRLVPRP